MPPRWAPSSRRRVELLYSARLAPPSSERRRYFNLLYLNADQIDRSLQLEPVLQTLGNDMRYWVAERSPRKLFLHAGVVGWEGKALVFVGGSGTGKSSLVAEFLKKGAVYYSDEYAVLDRQGRVHPFADRLRIGSKKQEKTAAQFGATTGKRSLPVGLVLFTAYREDQKRFRPAELSTGRGTLRLLEFSFGARRRHRTVLNILSGATRSARLLSGNRPEAKETVDALLRRYL